MEPAGNVVRFETRSDFIIRILGGDAPPAPSELRRIDEILFPMIRATLDLGKSFALESQAEEFRQFSDRLDHLSAMIRGEVECDADLEIRVRQILDEYAASFATIFSGDGLRKS